uniref:putative RING-H2 finger protein ATL19 n=1 Tax=Fragaria vesca subsp. vesca TaxID=101020 RepID=UPI0005C8E63E|nr:PREDICTED: putative RING-H2 finger protein ATL19 [Fragaria vesca subsp. vesca]
MNPVLSDFISLITFMVLCVIVGILEEKIKVARPGLAKPIDVLVNTLMIVIIYLVRNIVLGTLSIVDPTVDYWIVTGLSYGFYIPMLPCVYDILSTLGSTRRMVKLMHDATFLLVAIGAKSPQGYAIFSYQMDHEKGFCKGECAICLMEYETKDKCALLDKCGHTFHHKCLYENLAVSTSCPLCRECIKDSAPENKELP